jgi:WD40 repeat protein/energy-coupling factor transporter ATP-binding protein EcfA2
MHRKVDGLSASPTSAALRTEERINPFPGLRTFEPEEDFLFFGRERQIDELLRRLRTTRFLSIVGTSGSGKSSLVRAGLIPALYGGGMTRAGSSWRVAILRPGEDPIGNLATALGALDALGREGSEGDLVSYFFETTLRASNRGLIECIRQARLPPRANVLILIDQFEEIFRFRRSRRAVGRDEATGFVKLLLEAARSPEVPCYIALTMRSDFIGDCMEFGSLPEMVNAGLYLVPRMNRDELRSAICGPVAVGSASISPRLVSRLLNDAGDDPDQLPILQHALLRTWNRWEEKHVVAEPLDLRHYEAIGTMKEALSRHAEEAYEELDEEGRRIAQILFKALTESGTEGRGVRRPASLGEICALSGAEPAAVEAVVEVFRRPGRSFVMPPATAPLLESTILDLSHESLMRIWRRLASWVDEEARSAQLYLGVAQAAARHEEGAAALWRDPELQLALSWRERERPTAAWARRYDLAFERAMAFLDASREERDRELKEREARRRRELRRARHLVAILGTASLAMMVLGGVAYLKKLDAETATQKALAQEKEASRARTRAELSKSEALRQKDLAQSQRRLAEQERSNAERQSRIAEEQTRMAETERHKAEAKELEARAQKAAADAARLEAEGKSREANEQRALAVDLRQKAESSAQEAKELSDISAARALSLQTARLGQENERELPALLALEAYRLNRDNQGNPEDADLFNALRAALDGLRPPPMLRGHRDAVRALALTGDGQTLASGGEDGKVLLLDLSRPGAVATPLGELPSGVRALAVAGKRLAAGGATGMLWIWDLGSPSAPPRQLPVQGTAAIAALAFQPGGALLAAGGADGTVRLWDAERSTSPAATLATGGKRITAVAFRPGGKQLAIGLAQGGGALLWDVGLTSATPRVLCAGMDVRSLALSPDGRRLACGTGRGQIVLVDPEEPAAPAVPLLGHASSVNSLSFSPRGDHLASASSDGAVRLWDCKRPDAQPILLAGHEGWVWSVLFTTNGDRLVSGGEDRTVRFWEVRAARMASALCQQVHRGLTQQEWQRYMSADLAYRAQPLCPITR